MWNFGYHLARARGTFIRDSYRALLPVVVQQPSKSDKQLDLDVFTYSGESTLPEQVASARSFLRFAGRPASFTIVSDGSYSAHSISILRKLDPVIHVRNATEFIPHDIEPALRDYASYHPTGKQFALILSLPQQRPAFYFDSDVLFFPGSRELVNLRATTALYLRDCQFSGDERLLRGQSERADPVNTGVLLISQKPDWSLALQRFRELTGPPSFFTNQTLVHLAMHQSGASAFDPAKFVLQLDDQFVFADRYARPDIVLRHYVNPVRHKFWSSLLR
jgi:hypothetical protein